MGNERLARALAMIENAAATIDRADVGANRSADSDATAALSAEIESLKATHEAAVEDRDRTIAKLRADLADIGKLKDEEITRLRSELAERPTEALTPVIDEAEHQALQERFDRLESAAKSALSGLDTLIAGAEAQGHG